MHSLSAILVVLESTIQDAPEITMCIVLHSQYNPTNHDVSEDSGAATSLPLPLVKNGGGGAGLDGRGTGVDGWDMLEAVGPPASCHAGIEGFPGSTGVVGPVVTPGPRLRSRALRDFSSCCSSASDWFWLSLFFSII